MVVKLQHSANDFIMTISYDHQEILHKDNSLKSVWHGSLHIQKCLIYVTLRINDSLDNHTFHMMVADSKSHAESECVSPYMICNYSLLKITVSWLLVALVNCSDGVGWWTVSSRLWHGNTGRIFSGLHAAASACVQTSRWILVSSSSHYAKPHLSICRNVCTNLFRKLFLFLLYSPMLPPVC